MSQNAQTTTSSQFASCIAAGTDWRDTAKAVLEELEKTITEGANFNIGFLYVSDYLVKDMESILGLFRSVLKIDNWVGTVGLGVCGNGREYIDRPAISAMIGHVNKNDFCLFPAESAQNSDEQTPDIQNWIKDRQPMLVLAHADPLSEEDPAHIVKSLAEYTQGFVIGGLSASRHDHGQIIGTQLNESSISGVMFSSSIAVSTTLSQGCQPLGPYHRVTSGQDHEIITLDDAPALEIFEQDVRKIAMEKMGAVSMPDKPARISDDVPENEEEFKTLFKGEVHAAFPVTGSDQDNYMVRNLLGIDPDRGTIGIGDQVNTGDQVMFVHRDDDSLCADLSKKLVELRQRVTKERGIFAPKAAIYVSCVARGFNNFMSGEPKLQNDDGSSNIGEMKLVRDIIGDVPLAGFYAGGEISNARLYGYTGILTLFL